MIVSGHLHDAHEGNLLATSEGDESVDVNDDFRWHDFGDSFKRVGSVSRERLHELRDHVQKFEQRIVDALRDTLPSLAGALGAHGRCFKEFTTNQGFASQCLGFLAVEFATDVVKSHTLYTLEKRKFLERVSRGFAEQEMNRLWLDYSSSSTTSISQTATWVRQLQQDGKGGFEFVGNGFQVKDKDIQNIDDLKKAIKKEEELSIAPSKINIYIQEDGKWIGEDEEASVNRGTSKPGA
eukprot:symbB.v1.2.042218.t1/scaffold9498.1/size3062/1